VKPSHDEIDRMLDRAASVVDAEGKILGSRDLTPAEKKGPAVTILLVASTPWQEFEQDNDGWQ
jgi:hypothetical protein